MFGSSSTTSRRASAVRTSVMSLPESCAVTGASLRPGAASRLAPGWELPVSVAGQCGCQCGRSGLGLRVQPEQRGGGLWLDDGAGQLAHERLEGPAGDAPQQELVEHLAGATERGAVAAD